LQTASLLPGETCVTNLNFLTLKQVVPYNQLMRDIAKKEKPSFEQESDASSKIFVARQPIFRRNGQVFGYELLFRSGLDNFFDQSLDGDQATSKVITNTFSIGINKITGGKKAFINFSGEMLVHEYPSVFPPSITVAEVLETVKVTPRVLAACKNLVRRQYTLALDDFFFSEEFRPLIELARIIKYDVRAMTLEQLRRDLKKVGNYKIKLLAEKVETIEEYEILKKMGFSLFQGYYFSKPKIVQGRDIPGSKIQYLKIISVLQDENYNFQKIAKLISHDVSLSYKLLRYVNSAAMHRRQDVTSTQSALALLGEDTLRKWLSLIMLSYVADDKPQEILRSAFMRARFCEQIGEKLGKGRKFALGCYTVGMFSLLDVLLDQPMEEILAQLNLSQDITATLTGDISTPYAYILKMTIAYERGEWDEAIRLAAGIRDISSYLPLFYENALDELGKIYTPL